MLSSWYSTYGIRPVYSKDHPARPCNPRVRPSSICAPGESQLLFSLKLQRDKLKQYQKKVCSSVHVDRPSQNPPPQIQFILEREHQIAKSHLIAGDKDRALTALRRRKYQQSLLLRTDDQLAALEQLVGLAHRSIIYCITLLHRSLQSSSRWWKFQFCMA